MACAREVRRADPTGVGDAFRAGFLTGLAVGLAHRESAELGAMLATYVIETVGTQEYELSTAGLHGAARRGLRSESAGRIAPHVYCPRPVGGRRAGADRSSRPLGLGHHGRRARPEGRTSSPWAPTSQPGTLLAAYRAGLFPMGVGRDGAPAGRVVVPRTLGACCSRDASA